MKKKFKKYLIASFSAGFASLVFGSIAASCAMNTSAANNPDKSNGNGADTNSPSDPGSPTQSSLSTTPGQPLTQAQKDYQLKLANDIQLQYNANKELDYSIPEDKANIDEQISKYNNELNKDELANLITKYNQMLNPPESSNPTTDDEINNLLSTFYDNFKQKNLIPTQDEITKYAQLPADDKITWKIASGYYSIFYSSPKSIILLFQCLSIAVSNEEDQFDVSKVNSWNLAGASLQNTNLIFNNIKEGSLTEKSPAYQALEYYLNFFISKKT